MREAPERATVALAGRPLFEAKLGGTASRDMLRACSRV